MVHGRMLHLKSQHPSCYPQRACTHGWPYCLCKSSFSNTKVPRTGQLGPSCIYYGYSSLLPSPAHQSADASQFRPWEQLFPGSAGKACFSSFKTQYKCSVHKEMPGLSVPALLGHDNTQKHTPHTIHNSTHTLHTTHTYYYHTYIRVTIHTQDIAHRSTLHIQHTIHTSLKIICFYTILH